MKERFRGEDQNIGGYSQIMYERCHEDFDELESDGMRITGTCI